LVGFGQLKGELASVGAGVIAASVDFIDKAAEVQAEVSFPVAHGVTREVAGLLGSWWEERRGIIQPSEFILDDAGRVIASSYSDGPLGRMDAADVLRSLKSRERQAQK
jgi:alkyl hydroperoxide reductase subunit AhpC